MIGSEMASFSRVFFPFPRYLPLCQLREILRSIEVEVEAIETTVFIEYPIQKVELAVSDTYSMINSMQPGCQGAFVSLTHR